MGTSVNCYLSQEITELHEGPHLIRLTNYSVHVLYCTVLYQNIVYMYSTGQYSIVQYIACMVQIVSLTICLPSCNSAIWCYNLTLDPTSNQMKIKCKQLYQQHRHAWHSFSPSQVYIPINAQWMSWCINKTANRKKKIS